MVMSRKMFDFFSYRGVLDAAHSVVQPTENIALQTSLSKIRQMNATLPLPEEAASEDTAKSRCCQHLSLWVPV